MLIKSLIMRDGGTIVDIDGTEYKFVDDGNGNHVCDIADKSVLKKLLAVPEGFELLEVQDASGVVIDGEFVSLEDSTKKEIAELAAEQGIELSTEKTKKEMIEAFAKGAA